MPTSIPIVVFGDDWGRHVSSMQHLFRHICRDYTVIWVNAIGHRVPSLSRQDIRRVVNKFGNIMRGSVAQPSEGSGGIEIGASPRILIHPRVLPWHHYGPVRAVNRISLVRAIRGALAQLRMPEPPLLVTGSPPSISVFGAIGEIATLYYCMDDFLHLPNVSPEMLRPLEQELLGKVDALVATAEALVSSKRPRSGRAHYLPQGVNYEHFATPHPVPPELSGLPRPIIGFAGGVTTPVVDAELLRRVAAANPTGSLVLIGPVRMDLSQIAAPNVHAFGPRPYRDLPAYVQAFDVGIIPYALNPHTIAVDPLKLLEYLAAGVPVVTTDLPEVRKYRHAVWVEGTHDGFVNAVQTAVAATRSDRAKRQAVAREHGWDRRAAALAEIFGATVRAAQERSTAHASR